MIKKERTYTKEDIINIIMKSRETVIKDLEDTFKQAAKEMNKEITMLNVMTIDKLMDVINKEYE